MFVKFKVIYFIFIFAKNKEDTYHVGIPSEVVDMSEKKYIGLY